MATAVPDNFQNYLLRFGFKDPEKKKPGVCYEEKQSAANPEGYEELTRELCNQKKRHQDDMQKEKKEAERMLHNELKRGVNPDVDTFMKLIYDFIEKHERRKEKKSDVESASSTWDFKRFNKYIDTLKIQFQKPICKVLTQEETWFYIMFCSIQQRYLELAAVYLGVQVMETLELGRRVFFLEDMQNCEYREATTGVFVKALITPILLRYNMQVRLEEKLYTDDSLPKCIADYVIYSRTGEILGAIETKSGERLKAQSVIQCMLQLLALRRKAPHPLFGVVTDSIRYVFIVLRRDGTFVFEHDPEKPARVNYVFNTWEDLWRIFRVFKLLLVSSQER